MNFLDNFISRMLVASVIYSYWWQECDLPRNKWKITLLFILYIHTRIFLFVNWRFRSRHCLLENLLDLHMKKIGWHMMQWHLSLLVAFDVVTFEPLGGIWCSNIWASWWHLMQWHSSLLMAFDAVTDESLDDFWCSDWWGSWWRVLQQHLRLFIGFYAVTDDALLLIAFDAVTDEALFGVWCSNCQFCT